MKILPVWIAATLLVALMMRPTPLSADNLAADNPALMASTVNFGAQTNDNVLTDLVGMPIDATVPITIEIPCKWGHPLTLALPNFTVPQGRYTAGEILAKLEKASDGIHVRTTATTIDVQVVLSPGIDDLLQDEVGPKYSNSSSINALLGALGGTNGDALVYQPDQYYELGFGMPNLPVNLQATPLEPLNIQKPTKVRDVLDSIGLQLDAHWVAVVWDKHPFAAGPIVNGKAILHSFPDNIVGRAPICFCALEHLDKPAASP